MADADTNREGRLEDQEEEISPEHRLSDGERSPTRSPEGSRHEVQTKIEQQFKRKRSPSPKA